MLYSTLKVCHKACLNLSSSVSLNPKSLDQNRWWARLGKQSASPSEHTSIDAIRETGPLSHLSQPGPRNTTSLCIRKEMSFAARTCKGKNNPKIWKPNPLRFMSLWQVSLGETLTRKKSVNVLRKVMTAVVYPPFNTENYDYVHSAKVCLPKFLHQSYSEFETWQCLDWRQMDMTIPWARSC